MQRSSRLCNALVLPLAAALSSACAFTNIELTLPDTPLEQRLEGGKDRQVIVVIPFSDEREIRDRCGMQKNGYNMDTADAICQSDPNAWIASRIAQELERAGFDVLSPAETHRDSALRIEGDLLKIFVEPVIGAWSGSLEADLSVRLRATSDTGLEAERTFFVKGWKGGVMAWTTQPYLTSLDRAAKQMLEEIVRAVVELMDEYPQLGLWRPGPTIAVARAGGPR
jgi:hypothetical protein